MSLPLSITGLVLQPGGRFPWSSWGALACLQPRRGNFGRAILLQSTAHHDDPRLPPLGRQVGRVQRRRALQVGWQALASFRTRFGRETALFFASCIKSLVSPVAPRATLAARQAWATLSENAMASCRAPPVEQEARGFGKIAGNLCPSLVARSLSHGGAPAFEWQLKVFAAVATMVLRRQSPVPAAQPCFGAPKPGFSVSSTVRLGRLLWLLSLSFKACLPILEQPVCPSRLNVRRPACLALAAYASMMQLWLARAVQGTIP